MFLTIVVLIISAIITKAICSVLFSNTVGTLGAYITRTGAVFLIVLAVVGGIIGNFFA